jgi:lysophospholipase L1-like esterase
VSGKEFFLRRLAPALTLALLLPRLAGAQTTPATTYVAFGDSITAGVGDEPETRGGYPKRLQEILVARGASAEVRNEGLPSEDTSGGVTRINKVLRDGDDVLLLMEGTNDVNHVSLETTTANLAEIARRAAEHGLRTVHVTPIPRHPTASNDGKNILTGQLAAAIRELAFSQQRSLVDPFEVFFNETPNFQTLYAKDDKVHPNAAGYDLLARVFADVLTNVDSVLPVTGLVDPFNDQKNVSSSTSIRIDLYDFGAGLDLANTKLSVNGVDVETPISGSQRKVEIRYTPPAPFAGVVIVRLRSRDLATPPHTFDREVTQFTISGTSFLRGDIDLNGRVDGVDLLAFAPTFGAQRSDFRYKAYADINSDGIVDGQDLAILASNFGKASF